MTVRNQLFRTAKRRENLRKLDITLRRFTDDRLTKEQRLLISSALSRHSQHRLQVCRTAVAFDSAMKECAGETGARILFGCLETHPDAPAAALVCQGGSSGRSDAVYIYLPTETEEKKG